MNSIRSRAALAAFSLLVIVAIACGGSDDGSGSSPTATSSSSSSSPTATSQSQQQSNTDIEANMAKVTVGSTEYTFSMTGALGNQCVQLAGAIGGGGQEVGGADISLTIDLPPEDWETNTVAEWGPPYVRVSDDETNEDWRAGGDLVMQNDGIPESDSMVTGFSSDGSYASGTATFIDLNAWFLSNTSSQMAAPEPVDGTFEIYCVRN